MVLSRRVLGIKNEHAGRTALQPLNVSHKCFVRIIRTIYPKIDVTLAGDTDIKVALQPRRSVPTFVLPAHFLAPNPIAHHS